MVGSLAVEPDSTEKSTQALIRSCQQVVFLCLRTKYGEWIPVWENHSKLGFDAAHTKHPLPPPPLASWLLKGSHARSEGVFFSPTSFFRNDPGLTVGPKPLSHLLHHRHLPTNLRFFCVCRDEILWTPASSTCQRPTVPRHPVF